MLRTALIFSLVFTLQVHAQEPVQVQPVQVQPVQVQPVQVQPVQVQVQPVAQPVQAQPVEVQAQPVAQPVEVQAQPVAPQPEIKSAPVILPDDALIGKWIVDLEVVESLDIYKALNVDQKQEVVALLKSISLEWTLSSIKAKMGDREPESLGSYELISKSDGLYIIQTKFKNVVETIELQINQNKATLNPKTKILPLRKIL